jgi:hypothetical protein
LDEEDAGYLEYLSAKAAATHPDNGNADSDDDEDDEEWDVQGMLDEDVYFTTVLDDVDAYQTFEHLVNVLKMHGTLLILEGFLSHQERDQCARLVQQAIQNKQQPAEQQH